MSGLSQIPAIVLTPIDCWELGWSEGDAGWQVRLPPLSRWVGHTCHEPTGNVSRGMGISCITIVVGNGPFQGRTLLAQFFKLTEPSTPLRILQHFAAKVICDLLAILVISILGRFDKDIANSAAAPVEQPKPGPWSWPVPTRLVVHDAELLVAVVFCFKLSHLMWCKCFELSGLIFGLALPSVVRHCRGCHRAPFPERC